MPFETYDHREDKENIPVNGNGENIYYGAPSEGELGADEEFEPFLPLDQTPPPLEDESLEYEVSDERNMELSHDERNNEGDNLLTNESSNEEINRTNFPIPSQYNVSIDETSFQHPYYYDVTIRISPTSQNDEITDTVGNSNNNVPTHDRTTNLRRNEVVHLHDLFRYQYRVQIDYDNQTVPPNMASTDANGIIRINLNFFCLITGTNNARERILSYLPEDRENNLYTLDEYLRAALAAFPGLDGIYEDLRNIQFIFPLCDFCDEDTYGHSPNGNISIMGLRNFIISILTFNLSPLSCTIRIKEDNIPDVFDRAFEQFESFRRSYDNSLTAREFSRLLPLDQMFHSPSGSNVLTQSLTNGYRNIITEEENIRNDGVLIDGRWTGVVEPLQRRIYLQSLEQMLNEEVVVNNGRSDETLTDEGRNNSNILNSNQISNERPQNPNPNPSSSYNLLNYSINQQMSSIMNTPQQRYQNPISRHNNPYFLSPNYNIIYQPYQIYIPILISPPTPHVNAIPPFITPSQHYHNLYPSGHGIQPSYPQNNLNYPIGHGIQSSYPPNYLNYLSGHGIQSSYPPYNLSYLTGHGIQSSYPPNNLNIPNGNGIQSSYPLNNINFLNIPNGHGIQSSYPPNNMNFLNIPNGHGIQSSYPPNNMNFLNIPNGHGIQLSYPSNNLNYLNDPNYLNSTNNFSNTLPSIHIHPRNPHHYSQNISRPSEDNRFNFTGNNTVQNGEQVHLNLLSEMELNSHVTNSQEFSSRSNLLSEMESNNNATNSQEDSSQNRSLEREERFRRELYEATLLLLDSVNYNTDFFELGLADGRLLRNRFANPRTSDNQRILSDRSNGNASSDNYRIVTGTSLPSNGYDESSTVGRSVPSNANGRIIFGNPNSYEEGNRN